MRAFKNWGFVSKETNNGRNIKCSADAIEQFNRISKSAGLAVDVTAENLQIDLTVRSPACCLDPALPKTLRKSSVIEGRAPR